MRKLLAISLSLVLVASMAYASENSDDLGSWWTKLKDKIEKITPSKPSKSSTVTGGVRGAKEDTANTLYWKGKEKGNIVTKDELTSFNDALDFAINGYNAEAASRFEKFLKMYPSSPLAGDAQSALSKLQASVSAQPAQAQ